MIELYGVWSLFDFYLILWYQHLIRAVLCVAALCHDFKGIYLLERLSTEFYSDAGSGVHRTYVEVLGLSSIVCLLAGGANLCARQHSVPPLQHVAPP